MLTAESPLGCAVSRARRGPTWEEYDLTNSRQREEEADNDDDGPAAIAPYGVEAAGVASPLLLELLLDVAVLFQNFTTPSALPVITYPCRNDVQTCVTVCLCM